MSYFFIIYVDDSIFRIRYKLPRHVEKEEIIRINERIKEETGYQFFYDGSDYLRSRFPFLNLDLLYDRRETDKYVTIQDKVTVDQLIIVKAMSSVLIEEIQKLFPTVFVVIPELTTEIPLGGQKTNAILITSQEFNKIRQLYRKMLLSRIRTEIQNFKLFVQENTIRMMPLDLHEAMDNYISFIYDNSPCFGKIFIWKPEMAIYNGNTYDITKLKIKKTLLLFYKKTDGRFYMYDIDRKGFYRLPHASSDGVVCLGDLRVHGVWDKDKLKEDFQKIIDSWTVINLDSAYTGNVDNINIYDFIHEEYEEDFEDEEEEYEEDEEA